MVPLLMLAAVAVAPVDYRQDASWLWRPGRADGCAAGLPTGLMTLSGQHLAKPPATPPTQPTADCFYVYPTVSLDPTPNSDMVAGNEERGMATAQFARFGSVCRTFAPLYRQVTLTALRTMLAGGSAKPDLELPYADVRAAWRDYLARDNGGRPFVLIGHSQGSLVLKRLIVEEIDGRPIARRMLSAMLPGTTVEVPVGKDVGGSFKALSLCRADDQTGCILSWASYRDTVSPPPNALFGRAVTAGMAVACTNPAALGGGAVPLGAVLGFPWWRGGVAQYRAPETAASEPMFVRVPGLLNGECRTVGTATYLSVHVDSAAAGVPATLVDRAAIGDDVWPEWGWHVVDIAIVQDDLVRLVRRQTQAWRRANP